MTETARPIPLWRRVPAWFRRYSGVVAIVSIALVIVYGRNVNIPNDAALGDQFIYFERGYDDYFIILILIAACSLSIWLTSIYARFTRLRWLPLIFFLPIACIVGYEVFFYMMFQRYGRYTEPLHTADATYHLVCRQPFFDYNNSLLSTCTLVECDPHLGTSCEVIHIEDVTYNNRNRNILRDIEETIEFVNIRDTNESIYFTYTPDRSADHD